MRMATFSPLAVAFGVMLASSVAGFAQSPADFYKGKDVHLLISHPAGGGMDVYARFFARHLPKFLAGKPNVIPQNMPGAAGIAMANSLATQQPADGTVIGYGPGSIAVADLFNIPGARFDASKFSWIGSMNADVGVALSWRTSDVKTANDLFDKELIVAGGGATDQSVVYPTALNRVLGTKFKIIPGYPGSAAMGLAIERGEVSGIGGINFSSILANKPDWLRDKKVNILVQLALSRHPDLPDTPTVLQIAKTDTQRQVLELIFAQTELARSIFGPPGVPSDRLDALRAAFDAMMKDKDFLAEAERMKIEINSPTPGKDIDALLHKLRATDKKIIELAAAAIKTG